MTTEIFRKHALRGGGSRRRTPSPMWRRWCSREALHGNSQRGTGLGRNRSFIAHRRAAAVRSAGPRGGQRRPAHRTGLERVHGPTTLVDDVITGRAPALQLLQCQGLHPPCSTTRRRACIPTLTRWWRAPKAASRRARVSRPRRRRPCPPALRGCPDAERGHAGGHLFHLSAAAPATSGGATCPGRILPGGQRGGQA